VGCATRGRWEATGEVDVLVERVYIRERSKGGLWRRRRLTRGNDIAVVLSLCIDECQLVDSSKTIQIFLGCKFLGR
jgi:hypothetical protein